MALRKASAYSKRHARPFTRKSKKRSKSFVKTVPFSKIVKFKMGDLEGFKNNKYPITMTVRSKEQIQIRDNAVEAVRQYMNRWLVAKVGKEFYLEVKPYPHHFLRENKMLTGAGADRMQTGMARSYGKVMGRACLVKEGQVIFIVGVKTKKDEATARALIHSVKSRLPGKIQIETVDVNHKPSARKMAAAAAKIAANEGKTVEAPKKEKKEDKPKKVAKKEEKPKAEEKAEAPVEEKKEE